MTPELELRLRKCSTLPTLSAVAIEVLQRCQDDNLDFNEVARVIGRDPALSIKILKMANSPAFGLRSEIRSISQALGVLGLTTRRPGVCAKYVSGLSWWCSIAPMCPP